MPTPEYTDMITPTLVINKLTKAQYETIPNPSDTELYLVPDDDLREHRSYYTTGTATVDGETVDVDIMYEGVAPEGSVETDAVWTITTIVATLDGNVLSNDVDTDQTWDYPTPTPVVPVIDTTPPICYPTTASEVKPTSMVVKSSVSDNGKILTENGFVYNTSGNPTVSDTKVICDLGVGFMEKKLENLTQDTEYHIKSYGQNSSGLVYGSELVQATHRLITPLYYYQYLQLWLCADSVELTDGKVSRWYDLSPNQYEIIQPDASARPSITYSLNNNPVLTFNSQDFLYGEDILDLRTDSWTWIVVEKTITDGFFVSKNVYINSPGRWFFSSNMVWCHTSAANGDGRIDYNSKKVFDIITWENNRQIAKNKIYINNILNDEANISAPGYNIDYNCNFVIGGYIHPAYSSSLHSDRRFAGQIAEIIAFNTVNEDMRNNISMYLSDKYGITINT